MKLRKKNEKKNKERRKGSNLPGKVGCGFGRSMYDKCFFAMSRMLNTKRRLEGKVGWDTVDG